MKKRKLNKDIRKSITSSFGRFISIMFLMLLGSLALVGLAVTGPDMRKTGTNYFEKLNTADITIISDYGIDTSEKVQIEKASNIKNVEYIYLKDVTIDNKNDSIRVFSKPASISMYEITEGDLPNEDNEIAISDKYKGDYKIGDTIKFTEKSEDDKETLKNHEFTIVGFINSSEILSKLNLGQTTVGTGELNGYAIVNEDVFDSDVYMMAKLKFTDTENLDPYSDEYNDKIQVHKEELENLLKEQQETRLSGIKSEYQEKIDDGQKEVDDAKKELEDARCELSDAKTKIEDARTEISENETKLNDAQSEIQKNEKQLQNKENELNSKQKEYNNGLKDYESSKKELENAEKQINSSQTEINNNKTKLENGKNQYEVGIANLNEAISECEQALKNNNLPANTRAEIEQKLGTYKAQLSQTQTAYNDFMSNTYTPGISVVNQAQLALDQKKQEYNTAKTGLENADKQLKSAKTQLDSGKKELQNAKTKLQNAKKEYNSSKTKLENAKKELAEKEQEYNEKLTEFNEKEPDALKK